MAKKRTQKTTNNQSPTVQTTDGQKQFDVLPTPDAKLLHDEYYSNYVTHATTNYVLNDTIHSLYGTADLKKIRMSLDEE